MWMVDPEIMCRQHLLGEHKELHQLVGHIDAGNLSVIKGHAEKNQIDTSKIQERHEALVEEMKRRGFNHDSPLDYKDELDIGEVNSEKNVQDLIERCDDYKERYKEIS